MGKRGPKPQSDYLKRLKGNPGARPLVTEELNETFMVPAPPLAIEAPEFLTEERERRIFWRVVNDYLQRRIAHNVDVTSYGRWAYYVDKWMGLKELMHGKMQFVKITSNHGERWARNPAFQAMLDIERVLQSLEDRLGLNPVARQNIIRGLATMPAALGGQFGESRPDKLAVEQEKVPSPIGIGRLN